jgi:Zn-dependent protease with chaperone function
MSGPRKMRSRPMLLLSLFLSAYCICAAQPQPASSPSAPPQLAPSAYRLSPERAALASAQARASYQLYFLSLACTIAVLLLLLQLRMAPRLRDWAESVTRDRFLQALIFVPVFVLILEALLLPVKVAGHWSQLHFGHSIQGWGSWLADQAKSDLLAATAAVFLVWLVFTIIRRSPRHWWFYSWLGVLPVIVFSSFVNPLLIDPLFFHYTPLGDSQPGLVKQLERVIARSGKHVPEDRIFIMDASRKLNTLNALMAGLGGSARVVVWDTAVSRLSPPQILVIFGHELGHYVLGHIVQDMAFSMAMLFLISWVGFHAYRWAVHRFGDAWGLRGVEDWASLPVLLLLLFLLNVASTPAQNAFGRHLEQQADQYGLEVVHGIVPNSSEVAAEWYKTVAEDGPVELSPSTFVKVWFYDHPPLDERIRFAQDYNPWAAGRSPQFVK